jgi:hypothetical protein
MKTAVRLTLIASACVIAIGLCLIGFWRFAPDDVVWSSKIHRANRLIHQVESFQSAQGHLPATIEEMGKPVVDRDRYFYQKCSESRYIVWFGTTLGESMTYDSITKKWDSHSNGCPREAT